MPRLSPSDERWAWHWCGGHSVQRVAKTSVPPVPPRPNPDHANNKPKPSVRLGSMRVLSSPSSTLMAFVHHIPPPCVLTSRYDFHGILLAAVVDHELFVSYLPAKRKRIQHHHSDIFALPCLCLYMHVSFSTKHKNMRARSAECHCLSLIPAPHNVRKCTRSTSRCRQRTDM